MCGDDPTHVRRPPIGAEQQNQAVPAPPVPAPRPGGISIAGAQPVADATHVYDGERRGMRDVPPVPPPRPGPLQPPMNRDARSVPPVPAPATAGAQTVAAATHVYDGERRGMRDVPPVPPPRPGPLQPPPNRDARSVPPVPALATAGAQTVAAATHVYEDGDTFGMRLGPPLKREARRAPAVPPTPRPGRTTDSGAQSVAAATHVYENDDTVGPPLNPDARSAPPVPSTPRPARRTDDETDNPNQPPDAAGERRSIWERYCQGRGIAITIIIASVVMVSLMISVLVFLVHHASPPPHHESPVKTTGGPYTPGDTIWESSAVLKTVTSADVIMVDRAHGHTSPDPIRTDVDKAGPSQATGPPSTDTKEVSGGGSRSQIITFGDEPGAGKLRGARAVAVSPDKKIWVADRSKALLQVYSMEGAYLGQFPPGAQGLGYPSKRPSDVSIDKDGNLWVLMIGYPASLDSVVQVGRDGDLKAKFDLPDTVPRGALRGMAVGLRTNHVLVTWAGRHSGGVQAFDRDGKLLWEVGRQQRMKRPMNVAVNGKGNIFVSDHDTHFIYTFGETGQYVSKFGGPGRSGGDLSHPEGICADSSGHILVVDPRNQRVVMFTDRGRYVRHTAVRARSPTGVAVGPGGQLVVINSDTITVFPRY
ncbi:TRIM3 [Branchiostoma lanceolatum]|uniref:TRIM3 protein n=1 Tax=Branchiostoma lanceolatum TaxID=7740 RepID=A0A8K0A5Y0_BRALA|nr:TRIM3 [Branchiostoma lanceolatum]